MLTMRIIGRVPNDYPYTEPTVTWRVQLRDGRKAATFNLPGGPAFASGPGDLSLVLAVLRELADDADIDPQEALEGSGAELTLQDWQALQRLGQRITDGLTHLGQIG